MGVEPFSIAMAVPFSIAKGESLSMVEGCMASHLVKSAEVAHACLDAKADVQAIDEYRHGRALQHRHGRALQRRPGQVHRHRHGQIPQLQGPKRESSWMSRQTCRRQSYSG